MSDGVSRSDRRHISVYLYVSSDAAGVPAADVPGRGRRRGQHVLQLRPDGLAAPGALLRLQTRHQRSVYRGQGSGVSTHSGVSAVQRDSVPWVGTAAITVRRAPLESDVVR